MLHRPAANSTAAPIPAVDVVDVWRRPKSPNALEIAGRIFALPTTWRGFSIFLLGLLIIAAGTVLQVYLSAQILQEKVEINALRSQLDSVQRVNADYGWQIATLRRMEHVAARAKASGFQPVVDPIYVSRNGTDSPAAEALGNASAGPQPFSIDLAGRQRGEFNLTVPQVDVEEGSAAVWTWLQRAADEVGSAGEQAQTWMMAQFDAGRGRVQAWIASPEGRP